MDIIELCDFEKDRVDFFEKEIRDDILRFGFTTKGCSFYFYSGEKEYIYEYIKHVISNRYVYKLIDNNEENEFTHLIPTLISYSYDTIVDPANKCSSLCNFILEHLEYNNKMTIYYSEKYIEELNKKVIFYSYYDCNYEYGLYYGITSVVYDSTLNGYRLMGIDEDKKEILVGGYYCKKYDKNDNLIEIKYYSDSTRTRLHNMFGPAVINRLNGEANYYYMGNILTVEKAIELINNYKRLNTSNYGENKFRMTKLSAIMFQDKAILEYLESIEILIKLSK